MLRNQRNTFKVRHNEELHKIGQIDYGHGREHSSLCSVGFSSVRNLAASLAVNYNSCGSSIVGMWCSHSH